MYPRLSLGDFLRQWKLKLRPTGLRAEWRKKNLHREELMRQPGGRKEVGVFVNRGLEGSWKWVSGGKRKMEASSCQALCPQWVVSFCWTDTCGEPAVFWHGRWVKRWAVDLRGALALIDCINKLGRCVLNERRSPLCPTLDKERPSTIGVALERSQIEPKGAFLACSLGSSPCVVPVFQHHQQ